MSPEGARLAEMPLEQLLKAKTSEGAQELLARQETAIRELRHEAGGVLRLPEGTDVDWGTSTTRRPTTRR